jgi:anti-sigma-K factor RskA
MLNSKADKCLTLITPLIRGTIVPESGKLPITMTREEEENLASQFVSALLAPQTNRNAPPRIVNEQQIRSRVEAELRKLDPQQTKQAESAPAIEITNSLPSYRPASQATRPQSDPAWMRATTAQEVARLMGITDWASVR